MLMLIPVLEASGLESITLEQGATRGVSLESTVVDSLTTLLEPDGAADSIRDLLLLLLLLFLVKWRKFWSSVLLVGGWIGGREIGGGMAAAAD
jgi:hypothetical protein